MLTGLDVSGWQHTDRDHPHIDWALAREAGYQFAMIKAAQGMTWVSPWFVRDAQLAHEAGLLVGAYAYAVPGEAVPGDASADAKAQAMHLLGVTANVTCEMGLACDLEETGPYQLYTLGQFFLSWAETVGETGQAPILCVDRPYWEGIYNVLTGQRLWMRLGSDDFGVVPGDAKPWMVQTTPKETPGFASEVDQLLLLVPRGVNPSPPVPKPPPKEKT